MTAPRLSFADVFRRCSLRERKKMAKADLLRRRGEKQAAIAIYVELMRKRATCWPAVLDAALTATEICYHDWAIHHLERAARALPGLPEVWYNYGTVLQLVGRYADSEMALRRAVELAPDLTAARSNLALTLLGQGRIAEARAMFDDVLRITPESPEAKWNLSHVLMLAGDWLAGWEAYEARWQIPGFVEMNAIALDVNRPAHQTPLPWRGAPLDGRSILVVEEQGYGDTILCLRYAAQLRAMAARVVWAVRPEMVRLTRLAVAPSEVMSIRDPLPATDYIVACMSLHHRLGVTPATVPGAGGYIP